VCVNVGVVEINNDLQTMSVEAVATKHSLSPQIVWLHKQACLDTAERDRINEQYKIKVKNQMQNLIKIENVPEFLAVSEELLVSRMYNRQILGLLALTGRRTVEIALTGSLDPISDTTALFEGQAKTGDNESHPYVIPVLSDSSKLRDAIISLRSKKPEFLDYTHDNLNNTIASKLSRIVKNEYKGVFSPDYNITVHSLRGAYGALCTAFFKPVNMDGGEYLSTILGHSALDFTTRASYLKFYICEPQNV